MITCLLVHFLYNLPADKVCSDLQRGKTISNIQVALRSVKAAGLTQRLLGTVSCLLSCRDNGAIDPLQYQTHTEGVLAVLGLPWVPILTQQALL